MTPRRYAPSLGRTRGFPLYLAGGLMFSVLAYRIFAEPVEAVDHEPTHPTQLVHPTDTSSPPVAIEELMSFLDVHAWKVRLEIDEPYECVTPRLVCWERDENDAWRGNQLGGSFSDCTLDAAELEVTVFLRDEGDRYRFGGSIGEVGSLKSQLHEIEVPKEQVSWNGWWFHGGGALVDGHRILFAESRGALYEDLDALESFVSLQIEVHRSMDDL